MVCVSPENIESSVCETVEKVPDTVGDTRTHINYPYITEEPSHKVQGLFTLETILCETASESDKYTTG